MDLTTPTVDKTPTIDAVCAGGEPTPSDYLAKYGWLRKGLVDEMAASFAKNAKLLDEMPLENVNADELEKIERLRTMLLEAQGLTEPPNGWRAQHYTRTRLRHYLQARHGNLEAALKFVLKCIASLDEAVEKAKEFENGPDEYKILATRYTPLGFYGSDKRGCSVCYYRVGMHDAGGVLRETSTAFYLAQDWYFALWYWHTLELESLAARTNLEGRLCVIDVSGISFGRALGLISAFKKQKAQYPGGEQPTPDGATGIWMVSLPWFIEKLWKVVKGMLPASEQAKVKMFGKRDPRFLKELQRVVSLDQVPPWLGGTSSEPWPYGAGGDVYPGAAKDIAEELKRAAAGERFPGGWKATGIAAAGGAGDTSPKAVAEVEASPRSSAAAMAAENVKLVC